MLERCESIMSEAIKKHGAGRLVMAPGNTGPVVSGTVIAIDAAPNEDVQWIWSHDPLRGSYVSGYTIVPRMGAEQAGRVLDRYEPHKEDEAVSDGEVASRVAQLTERVESHEVVLGILSNVCDLMKSSASANDG